MEFEKCLDCNKCKKTIHRKEDEKNTLKKRLNIIEGQIRGIKQMLDDDRHCEDILTQMLSINKSIESIENSMLESHIKNCVISQIKLGNDSMLDSTMELIKRLR